MEQTNNSLAEKHCLVCEGGIAPLTQQEAEKLLKKIPLWQLTVNHKEIFRHFHFKNFHHTMAFVNAIAWIAHQENHHPDLAVGYNYCKVHFYTHAIDGLSENDFICAAKIDKLVANEYAS